MLEPLTLNILFIEDDDVFARVSIATLRAAQGIGYLNFTAHIEVAHSMNVAASLCEKTAFDVGVIDLGLPDSSGLETVSRARRYLGDSAIVVVTGDDTVDGDQYRANGVSFLYKSDLAKELYRLARVIRAAALEVKYSRLLREKTEMNTRLNMMEEQLNTLTSEVTTLKARRGRLAKILKDIGSFVVWLVKTVLGIK